MRKLRQPVVDPHACSETGWCVDVCPNDCLEIWNGLPTLTFPDRCNSCAACVLVCPTKALSIEDFNRPSAPPSSPENCSPLDLRPNTS